MLASIDVTTEGDALLRHLPRISERKDLEASTIRQYRSSPAIKLLQSSGSPQHVRPGSQVEVIGITEDNFRTHFLPEFAHMYRLDGANRSHRHKYRCVYVSVWRVQYTGTCV